MILCMNLIIGSGESYDGYNISFWKLNQSLASIGFHLLKWLKDEHNSLLSRKQHTKQLMHPLPIYMHANIVSLLQPGITSYAVLTITVNLILKNQISSASGRTQSGKGKVCFAILFERKDEIISIVYKQGAQRTIHSVENQNKGLGFIFSTTEYGQSKSLTVKVRWESNCHGSREYKHNFKQSVNNSNPKKVKII